MSSMSSNPVAIIDTLNSLLDAEVNSLFRFMGEGSPYLSKTSAEMRKPLLHMVAAGEQHMVELGQIVEALNGVPSSRHVKPEEQYLAYLSIKFLLPKLLQDKQLMIERYTNAKSTMLGAPAEVGELLDRHLKVHVQHAKILAQASVAK